MSSLLRAGSKALVKNGKGGVALSCVADAIDEREKSRIVKLLKGAQLDEEREEERQRKKAEQQALQVLRDQERVLREREREIQRRDAAARRLAEIGRASCRERVF